MKQPAGAVNYEFRIRGLLGDTLLSAFPGLQAEMQGGETVLAGSLPDQSALYGVLVQIEQLGLELFDVRRPRS
jgi:predicted RNA-binding protein with PUA domain